MKLLESRFSFRLLWIAGVIALCGSLFLILWFWRGAIPSGNTSGVWAAIANDFAEGVFYRPVFDESGYGGTRYMPLFFVLYGALISFFHDPVTAGFLLSIATLVFLDLGIYFLLRETGAPKAIAIPLTFLVHASISFQLLTLETRGDFLAAGMNVWGILLALKHIRTNSWGILTLSTGFFIGALFTKFTTIGGLAVVVLYFLIREKRSSAFYLIGVTSISIFALLWGVNEFSQGKALASFQACALGGFNFDYALKTPIWFLTVTIQDPFLFAIMCLAIYLMQREKVDQWKTFVPLYFGFTLVSTFAIFSSPGTDSNHLIDLLIACILVLAFQFQKDESFSKTYNACFLFVTIGILFMWIPGTISIKDHIEPIGRPTRDTIRAIAGELGPQAKNLLSENPMVPLLMGQRPIVMDAFSLRVIAQKSPAIQADFIRKIEDQFFDAIILLDWSGAPLDQLENAMEKHSSLGVDRFYGEVHFSGGFLDLMKKHYFLSFVKRPYVIYEPTKKSPLKSH
jgi:hypothetical protein